MTPADEGEFPHAPNDPTLIKQAEMWLRTDAIFFKLEKLFETIKGWMAHWTDRGPQDHEQSDREAMRDLIRKTVRATVEIQGNYNEGGNGSSPQWRNWVMTMLGTLIVIGITGLIVMYANQKAMEIRMNGVEVRITNIEHKIWP